MSERADEPKFVADHGGYEPVKAAGLARIMAEEGHVRDGLAGGVVTVEEHRGRMDGLMDQGHAIGVIAHREIRLEVEQLDQKFGVEAERDDDGMEPDYGW